MMTCLWSQTALAMPKGEQALESIAPDPLPGLCWILAEVRPPGEGLEHTGAPPRIRPWVCVCVCRRGMWKAHTLLVNSSSQL